MKSWARNVCSEALSAHGGHAVAGRSLVQFHSGLCHRKVSGSLPLALFHNCLVIGCFAQLTSLSFCFTLYIFAWFFFFSFEVVSYCVAQPGFVFGTPLQNAGIGKHHHVCLTSFIFVSSRASKSSDSLALYPLFSTLRFAVLDHLFSIGRVLSGKCSFPVVIGVPKSNFRENKVYFDLQFLR